MQRFKFLRLATSLYIILAIFLNPVLSTIYARNTGEKKPGLKFRADRNFTVVQFADIQDGPDTDPRTIDLMNKILDFEKPDLVVLTGDNIDGRCKSAEDVKKAIDTIANPMEKRHIPWAIVFGNHDAEHGKMSEEDMMKLYMSYPYNISQRGPEKINGIGNYHLLINGSQNNDPVFNIYMLNSGRYAAAGIGGYDWIKFNQIQWYRDTSAHLANKYGKPIPALMFFHIPLPEWKQMWDGGKALGERNEEECPPKINSGLFSSLIEMGDVKGIFVGHDHTNDYTGELYGIKLGFARNVGYATYGKEGFSRCARVFRINEADPAHFDTWIRTASDFR